MGLESVTYISDFVITNPVGGPGGDVISEGDDHIRNIKKGTKNTLPNLSGEVASTHTELNHAVGIDQNLAIALTGKTAAGIATTGGSSTVYTLTTGEGLSTTPDRFVIKMHTTCGADPTITVDSASAADLVDKDGATFEIGDIPGGVVLDCAFDGTDVFVIGGLDSATTGSVTFSNYAIQGPGSTTFTVPAGITVVQLRLNGPGGDGSDGNDNIAHDALTDAGPGGGSGAFGVVQIPVTPGQELDCIEGTTGTATSVTDSLLGHTYNAGSGVNGLATDTGAAGGVCSTSGSGVQPWIINRSGSVGGVSGSGSSFYGGSGAGAPGSTGNGNAGSGGTTGPPAGADGGDGSGGAAGGTAGTASAVAGAGDDGTYIATKDVDGGAGGGLGIRNEAPPYDDGGDGGYPGGGGGGRCGIDGVRGFGANGHIIIEY